MRFQRALCLGLLGFLSQGHVLAHILSKRTFWEDGMVEWPQKPTVQLKDIKNMKDIHLGHPVYKAEVEGFGTVAYKHWNTGLSKDLAYRLVGAEVEAYRAIEGKSIGPKFLAIVEKDGRPVGILLELIDDADALGEGDLESCVNKLKALHKQGVLYGDDLASSQFLKKHGNFWLIDYEWAHPPGKDQSKEETEAEMEREVAVLREWWA
ncbi:Uu.00g043260.m01.CDS01 [Anthostomella pinea]|uniref:Uu.00g043260.m01.CDS01 n=1 Tax=Anthostomella pinea TaxID=933095 RepID=A0AAI8V5Q9_9PEZI|nr:Uu.00g043260.m01.CDS01 [Anthostomella pinea]